MVGEKVVVFGGPDCGVVGGFEYCVGVIVGKFVGESLGLFVGSFDGIFVGDLDGILVG